MATRTKAGVIASSVIGMALTRVKAEVVDLFTYLQNRFDQAYKHYTRSLVGSLLVLLGGIVLLVAGYVAIIEYVSPQVTLLGIGIILLVAGIIIRFTR